MAVQVNEIIIRATVSEDGKSKHGGGHEKKTNTDHSGKDAIITECVEQVLEILKKEIKR